MDKKLFILAGLGILFAGMKKSTTPPTPDGGGGTTPGGPAPGVQTPDPVGGALTEATGAIIKGAGGTVASALAAALAKALAGGTAAGTAGDAALATTTAGVAHEGAAGITGASTTAGGATGGGGAAGGATATALAGLSAASIAIVAVYVAVVIVVIIVTAIFAANMKLKTAIGELTRRAGADLHDFEIELFERIRTSLNMFGDFTSLIVGDPRLRFGTDPGGRTTFAYRPRLLKAGTTGPEWMGADSPAVANLRMYKQIRALSLEYIHYRARLLDSMGNGFYPDLYERGFATNDVMASFNVALRRISDFAQAGAAARAATESTLPPADWGGFENFPLLDGQTTYSATHPESLSYGRPSSAQWSRTGPAEWFVARDASPDNAFLGSAYGTRLLQSARLKALSEVMALFRNDPTVVFGFGLEGLYNAWAGYAHFVVNRLGISDVVYFYPGTAQSEVWNLWTFYTAPSFFGAQVAFDVWEIREPAGTVTGASARMTKRNAGVPLDDKRLGATWLAD